MVLQSNAFNIALCVSLFFSYVCCSLYKTSDHVCRTLHLQNIVFEEINKRDSGGFFGRWKYVGVCVFSANARRHKKLIRKILP